MTANSLLIRLGIVGLAQQGDNAILNFMVVVAGFIAIIIIRNIIVLASVVSANSEISIYTVIACASLPQHGIT
jgi:hypothetical protein